MKKMIVLCLALLLLSGVVFAAKKQDKWIAIIAEPDPQARLQKLETFYQEYGDEKDKITPLVYLKFSDTYFQLKNYELCVQWGEKALAYAGIEDSDKLPLLLNLANACNQLKNDPDRALRFAQETVAMGHNVAKASPSSAVLVARFVAPALRIQVQIYSSKGKTEENLRLAMEKAVESYKLDNSNESYRYILGLLRDLNEIKAYEVIRTNLEEVWSIKPTPEVAKVLARVYDAKGDRPKTIDYFQKAYDLKKDADSARSLAVLSLMGKAKEEITKDLLATVADRYAEWWTLLDKKPEDPTQDKTYQHWMNVIANLLAQEGTEVPIEQVEAKKNELLEAAKARLGLQSPTPTQSQS